MFIRAGACLRATSADGFERLPISATRFVETGLEITWAHIGLENAREDAQGALRRGQWKVLEYALQRMLQTACMVTLGTHGVSPQPPLEEAVLDATRRLPLADDLLAGIG
ncbi:MAG: hypothetical protein VB131_06635 [Burkholderia gladioli]